MHDRFRAAGVDDNGKITRFLEKPADLRVCQTIPTRHIASMGIYVFNADYLYNLLDEDCADNTSSHDFGKDIIPKIVSQGNAMAHYFSMSCVPPAQFVPPYWRDVGTVDSFWMTNLELTSNMPQLNIYDEDWPIWTYQEQEPPAKFVPDPHGMDGVISNTMVSGGCIICGSKISQYHSVFKGTRSGVLQSRSGCCTAGL